MLRDYQQAAFDAAKEWMRRSHEPCLIEAATGAGKSHIVAAVAEWIGGTHAYKVLCIQPSKELVEQNYAKYLATGNPASIYCASISKSLAHPVIFGTPQTISNGLSAIKNIKTVIVDEAHQITPTVKNIIAHLRSCNDKLRVLGLTATPYRTGEGVIYQYDTGGSPTMARDPYFNTLVYQITARDLIARGFLSPVVTESHDGYLTNHLQLNKMGKFDVKEIEQTFVGKGRKTSLIVEDIVKQSSDRKGVLIFAATIQHAEEIMLSLPINSEIITGKTPKKERERVLRDFKAMRIKYLVNVAVLTTGFDAPHVDVIALMRATESPGLLQQIIGRGLRTDAGKHDCLVLDYAENLDRHCPDGDVFNPLVQVVGNASSNTLIKAACPICYAVNQFTARKNDEEYAIDEQGYFVDLMGSRITCEYGDIPAHYGRRCYGQKISKTGASVRCNYRWTAKQCNECDAENDIAARRCTSCDAELVDPNEKLRLEFAKIKSDPYQVSTDKVLNCTATKWQSAAGNLTIKIDYNTECRKFSAWYMPKQERLWSDLCIAVFGKIAPDVETFDQYFASHGTMPTSVTVAKDKQSGFYRVYGHNRPVDELQDI